MGRKAKLMFDLAAVPPWIWPVTQVETWLHTRKEVLAILDDVLSLKGRSLGFADTTPLLGGLPELDSMAVVSVLTSLEERFGFAVDDDEIDGTTFETVGSLVAFVQGKLAT